MRGTAGIVCLNNTRGGGGCTSVPPPHEEDRRGQLEVEDEAPSLIDNLSGYFSVTCLLCLTLTGGADENIGLLDSLGPGAGDLATLSSLGEHFSCHDAGGARKISGHQQVINGS